MNKHFERFHIMKKYHWKLKKCNYSFEFYRLEDTGVEVVDIVVGKIVVVVVARIELVVEGKIVVVAHKEKQQVQVKERRG